MMVIISVLVFLVTLYQVEADKARTMNDDMYSSGSVFTLVKLVSIFSAVFDGMSDSMLLLDFDRPPSTSR